MIGRALFLCVGISLLMPVTAAAEDGPRVLVSVDPSVATVGETVQYTVQLLMAGQQSARLVSNPGFGPLEVLGTNRGTEFRSTPQGSSLSYNFNFSVRGRKAGTFIIKGPKALVGGKEIEGGSVKLKLVEKGKELPASDQAGPIMVVGRFSDMKPFVGQQIQVDYTLLFDTRKVGVFGVDVVDVKSPEFDGFWIENLGQRVRTREKRRVINGRQYNVRPVQLLSVFALREGKVEIEPLELAVESSGRNSMRRSRKLVSTKAFELDVQPLPPGAPAGFHTSNVGQYSFEVATDKIKVAVGEPLLVSLIANGTGMVGRLKLPRIPAGEGYELLEPVERKKAEMVGRLVGGQKMAEVVLTPTKGGVLTIPELTLHTFDPQRGEYVSLTSKKMMVAVAGRVSKPLKKEEDVVERDASKPDALRLAQMPLRPVRPLGVRTESRSGLLGDPLFLLGLAAPPTHTTLHRENDGEYSADGALELRRAPV